MPEAMAEIPGRPAQLDDREDYLSRSRRRNRASRLNGALLIVQPTGLTMVATDGHRLALVETMADLGGSGSVYRALLPRKAMQEILKLTAEAGADAKIRFAGDDNHLFFQIGERLSD